MVAKAKLVDLLCSPPPAASLRFAGLNTASCSSGLGYKLGFIKKKKKKITVWQDEGIAQSCSNEDPHWVEAEHQPVHTH